MKLAAGYGKYPQAYIEIPRYEGDKLYLEDIDNAQKISLKTPYRTLNDVVVFEEQEGNYNSIKIIKIFWSKSMGIIQFEQSDGEVFQLTAFERIEAD